MAKCVTRYAPSSSGWMTIAGIRSCIYNYAYAKKHNGKFVLRIEDTNLETCKNEYTLDFINCLNWMGIEYNGPRIEEVERDILKEEHFQSKRGNIYNRYVEKLIKEDKAYRNQDNSVVMRMPQKRYTLVDSVFGNITFPVDKDFIIQRSNSQTTFYLANAVDDFLGETTLLVRGADHINNFPKFASLYEALGFSTPELASLPMILDEQGEKLSKRRGDQNGNISDLRKEGIVPKAIISAVSCLGWSHPEKTEIFGLDDLIKHFDFAKCINVNSRYSYKKLLSLNRKVLETLSREEFHQELLRFGKDYFPELTKQLLGKDKWEFLLTSSRKIKHKTLREVMDCEWLLGFKQPKEEDKTLIIIDNLLEETAKILESSQWNIDALQKTISGIANDKKLKQGFVSQPIRLSLTGSLTSPPLEDVLVILGKKESLQRINLTLKKDVCHI